MKIYLMRHGEAVSPSGWKEDDASRPLSALGISTLEKAAAEIARVGFIADSLLTSPLVRAKMTCAILERNLGSLKSVVSAELAAGNSLRTLKSLIKKYASRSSLWMIGHMPDLAVLGSSLSMEASVLEKGLKPGEMLAVEGDFSEGEWNGGRLLWYRKLEEWKKIKAL